MGRPTNSNSNSNSGGGGSKNNRGNKRRSNGGSGGGGGSRNNNQLDRHLATSSNRNDMEEDDYSTYSAATDTTRPTVHTNKRMTESPRRDGSRLPPSATLSSPSGKNRNLSINTGNTGAAGAFGGGNNSPGNPRQRVPGGAAAKLMLRGPQKSVSSDGASSHYSGRSSTGNNSNKASNHHMERSNQDDEDKPVDTTEIYETMSKTKEEFETGPKSVGRYSPVTIVGDEEIEVSFQFTGAELALQPEDLENSSKEPLPQILSREDAYHENAAAAVAAILTPISRGGDNASVGSGMTELHSQLSYASGSRISGTGGGGGAGAGAGSPTPVSAFQSPKYSTISNNNSLNGVGSDALSTNGSGGLDSMADTSNHGGLHKSPTTEPLISCATEEKLDKMSSKMMDPSKTLSDLLRAIASPDDITTIDRAYMVRRKNACGALKVLTAHNRRRRQICWTVGVLPALTSVLQDAGEDRLELVYPDQRTRMEYEETRRRAIAALTNLAMPVPNRLAVFHTPGLVQALISIVTREPGGECLEGACAILAYLAKSNENKILMAQVPGLMDAVLRVLKPQISPGSPKNQSSVSESDSSASSADEDDDEDGSIMSGSTHTYSEGGTSEEDLDEDYMKDEEDEADFTDEDDMSTDGESLSGSEASSGSSMSESSGDESRSEHRAPPKRRNKSQSGKNKVSQSNAAPPSGQPSSKSKLYSNYDKDKYVSGARKNLFAMLGHLVKEKDNAYRLARVNDLAPIVVEISRMHESPIHILAIQLLAHLTRHRLNCKMLIFKMQMVLPALVQATYSTNDVGRRYACFAIQNFSHDKSCRQELASSDNLIVALCKRARHSKDPDERLAAVCSLKNLTDEPANLIPLSNTAECIATLMQIAHGQEEGVTEMMQFKACDALATISHWLRKIATNGQSMDAIKNGESKPAGMFVPSLKVVGWDQYE